MNMEPTQENEDPKKWLEQGAFVSFKQRNNKFVKNSEENWVWAKGGKCWRSNSEYNSSFNKLVLQTLLLPSLG